MKWKDLEVIDIDVDIKGMSRNQLVEIFGYTDKGITRTIFRNK